MSVVASEVITGKIYWPFLSKTNPMKQGKYTLDVGHLTKKSMATIKKMGLTVKTETQAEVDAKNKEGAAKAKEEDKKFYPKPYRGSFISLKSGYVPAILDTHKNPVDPAIIANDTEAHIRATAYEYTWKGTKGLSGGVNMIQITKLVEFQHTLDTTGFDFEEDDDFELDTGDDIPADDGVATQADSEFNDPDD